MSSSRTRQWHRTIYSWISINWTIQQAYKVVASSIDTHRTLITNNLYPKQGLYKKVVDPLACTDINLPCRYKPKEPPRDVLIFNIELLDCLSWFDDQLNEQPYSNDQLQLRTEFLVYCLRISSWWLLTAAYLVACKLSAFANPCLQKAILTAFRLEGSFLPYS